MKTFTFLLVAAMALMVLPSLAQEEPADKPAVESSSTTNKVDHELSADEAIDKAKDATNKAIDTAKDAIIEAIEKAKEHTSSAIDSGKEATEDAIDKASEATSILDKAAEATREILEKVKQATSAILEKAKEVTEQKSEADEPTDTPPAPGPNAPKSSD
jgi:Skp family chaperone for outer membrane proteins